MRLAIVTDAWAPQVNGVVRTLESVTGELAAMGHETLVIAPDGFRSLPCPTYPEIRLAIAGRAAVGRRIEGFRAEAVHIATEGPLGLSARRWCLDRGRPFTTAYHTQFPEYVAARTGADPEWIWRFISWFHRPADAILVSTPTIQRSLEARGLTSIRRWGRGVSPAFTAHGRLDATMAALPGPVMLCVGRVAVEKNIEAFLSTPYAGASKVVVGEGPALAGLKQRFPEAHFLGARFGEDLAACYRAAHVLVFPSRTDTFGLVMIEALACGTPVAAYPVAGPVDVLTPDTGMMHDDLAQAITAALALDRATCAAAGARFTWRASAEQFLGALIPIDLARAA